MKVLTGSTGIPYVVGDDDQSIYRWRGARVENLQQYRKDYHGVQLFRLEQNYRSTGNILAAANAVISNNSGRIGKKLWTSDGAGTPIRLYRAYNERDEAEFVINKIREWIARDGHRATTRSCIARTRSHACFEEYLLAARIPVSRVRRPALLRRQEIKDALAYLRLISNRDDDASFERVVNLPTRGIGARTLEVLRAHARTQGTSMWQAAQACGDELGTKPRQACRRSWA
jgi:DNA helicase-2/ATP-dependent DNA helicase PcrA